MGVRWSRMSWSERNELWTRWRRGETLRSIARALKRGPSSICDIVEAEGGIAPRRRGRSRLALTATEREDISRQLARGLSLRAIGEAVRRAPSTISREVTRNGGRTAYRAAAAEGRAWRQGRRAKRCRLATHRALRRAVATKLAQQWSPQQISGWLRHTFPSDPAMQVSPETIYRSLFIQSRGTEAGAARPAPAAAPLSTDARERARPSPSGADPGRRLDSRAAGRRRGPRRTGSLGGRPAGRHPRHLHCDAGRAPIPLRAARARAEQRNADGDSRLGPPHPSPPTRAGEIIDLGSGPNWRAPPLHRRHRCPGVLL